jgi:hypothetical protein
MIGGGEARIGADGAPTGLDGMLTKPNGVDGVMARPDRADGADGAASGPDGVFTDTDGMFIGADEVFTGADRQGCLWGGPPARPVRPIDLRARLVRVKRALTNHHGKSDLPCPRWLPHGPPRH